MKFLAVFAFVAMASALEPVQVPAAALPQRTLNIAKDFAPIDLNQEAVRVVESPIYETISRSELETIRVAQPVETFKVIDAPMEVAPAVEKVRVVDAPVAEEIVDKVRVVDSPVAEQVDQVRVVEAPLSAAPVKEQVRIADAPELLRPMYPQMYDSDMLR